jgi:hypothetical protein
MFLKITKTKHYRYLRIVENYRQNGKLKQRVITHLGNLSTIPKKQIDNLIKSLSQFSSQSFFTTHDLQHNLHLRGESAESLYFSADPK